MTRPLPDPADGTLRIASWNIRKCLGIDRRRDPDRTLRVISATRADVVVLQESDRRLSPRPAALPARLIRDGSVYHPLPLGQSSVSLGWHGNAILVRSGIELVAHHQLDLPSFEPRGAVAADLTIDGQGLRVVGVHLGLLGNDRLRQLGRLSDWLSQQAPLPTMILGDFNEWSSDALFPPLAPGYRILSPGRSFHARLRLAPLDRIALGSGVEVAATGLMDQGDAARASDHLPIWADVKIDP